MKNQFFQSFRFRVLSSNFTQNSLIFLNHEQIRWCSLNYSLSISDLLRCQIPDKTSSVTATMTMQNMTPNTIIQLDGHRWVCGWCKSGRGFWKLQSLVIQKEDTVDPLAIHSKIQWLKTKQDRNKIETEGTDLSLHNSPYLYKQSVPIARGFRLTRQFGKGNCAVVFFA